MKTNEDGHTNTPHPQQFVHTCFTSNSGVNFPSIQSSRAFHTLQLANLIECTNVSISISWNCDCGNSKKEIRFKISKPFQSFFPSTLFGVRMERAGKMVDWSGMGVVCVCVSVYILIMWFDQAVINS